MVIFTAGVREGLRGMRMIPQPCSADRLPPVFSVCGWGARVYNARMHPSWIHPSPSGAAITVHAAPRASADAVQGLHGDALKIRLNAPPVDGKANAELVHFLSSKLGIAKSNIAIKRGLNQRRKIIGINGLSAAEIEKRLLG